MTRFRNHILGESDKEIPVDSSEEIIKATQLMVEQAQRTLDIISRDLEPRVYGTPEFVEAARQMVLKSRYSKVRIIVHEPQKIMKHGHRLIDLALHLTSFFELRVPGKEYESFNEALFVADTTGYIHRLNNERFEGQVNFSDRRVARFLVHQFDEIWEKSRQDVNLKRALL